VSDGIVGGVMAGGFVVVGRTGNAGHLGHILVQGFQDQCECGNLGCLEAIAGGASMLRWAHTEGWAGDTVDELLADGASGSPIAVAALERAGLALGRAIVSVAALLDIDLVVVGGPVIQSGSVLWKSMYSSVTTHARLGFLMGLQVVPSELRDLGVLAGAGVLALTTTAS